MWNNQVFSIHNVAIDELCLEFSAKNFIVSAKSGKGISEIFDYIAGGKCLINLEMAGVIKQNNTRSSLKPSKHK